MTPLSAKRGSPTWPQVILCQPHSTNKTIPRPVRRPGPPQHMTAGPDALEALGKHALALQLSILAPPARNPE
jgi:alkanesulfonate monooxygenase SsuD/methylene tetrahydromethanopterin reductase-like flavin-dependent oxidoreductase (luciferase family)